MSDTRAVPKGPSSHIVQEVMRTVEVALGRHIEAEKAAERPERPAIRGPRWMGERYGLGMAATHMRGRLVVTVMQYELLPIIQQPLEPARGYTAAAKIDELLVILGSICIVLGCNPLGGARLRELRAALNRLLAT